MSAAPWTPSEKRKEATRIRETLAAVDSRRAWGGMEPIEHRINQLELWVACLMYDHASQLEVEADAAERVATEGSTQPDAAKVERVARAICRQPPDCQQICEHCLIDARAALTAAQEQT